MKLFVSLLGAKVKGECDEMFANSSKTFKYI